MVLTGYALATYWVESIQATLLSTASRRALEPRIEPWHRGWETVWGVDPLAQREVRNALVWNHTRRGA
jgi:hypothetical protein